MSARLPILRKTPFVFDPRPLTEASSPHAGALAISRAFRSLGYPGLIEANVRVKKRKRGFDESQFIEQISMLQAIGGDCPEDMRLLAQDEYLERGLGYKPRKSRRSESFRKSFTTRSWKACVRSARCRRASSFQRVIRFEPFRMCRRAGFGISPGAIRKGGNPSGLPPWIRM